MTIYLIREVDQKGRSQRGRKIYKSTKQTDDFIDHLLYQDLMLDSGPWKISMFDLILFLAEMNEFLWCNRCRRIAGILFYFFYFIVADGVLIQFHDTIAQSVNYHQRKKADGLSCPCAAASHSPTNGM